MREYRYGTPSIDEWDGFWKRNPDEPYVTIEEFEAVYALLHKTYFGGAPRSEVGYFHGDSNGERTELFELRNREFLTIKLVASLQHLLRQLELWNWRIIIATYIPYDVICIYPDIVRIHRRHASLEAAVETLRKDMARGGFAGPKEE